MRAIAVAAVLALASVREVGAQTVEIAGTFGVSCRGSDGTFCAEDDLRSTSIEGGVWLGGNFRVGGRWGRVSLPDRGSPEFRPVIVRADRAETFGTAEVLYHFQSDKRVRVFIGGGFGTMSRTETVRCAAAGCNPQGWSLGTFESRAVDPVFAAGVLFLPLESLPVRASLRIHGAFGESHSQELFLLSAGYRF